jgi:glycosyltransferase involved in cell wall biosynthesis
MPLRVVHINTADLTGGAGIAGYRLHQALNLLPDVESFQLVGIRTSTDPQVASICRNRPEYLLSRLVHRTLRLADLGGVCSPLQAIASHPLVRSADVVHMHHINGGFFSYTELIRLSWYVPLVWTLHDMWGFTGTCHNSIDCTRWENECGSCPNPAPGVRLDLSRWHWRRKQDCYRSARLTVVTPSNWLAGLARISPLMRHLPVHCIPNAIDTAVFKPAADREELRRLWGITLAAKVVMIGSAALDDERKGAGRLLQVLSELPEQLRAEMTVLLVGNGNVERFERAFGCGRVVATGYINNPERMADCYALSDLFLLATEADNLPNTLVEALACGTPAVTFAVGGCGDVVRHLETGYLAKAGDFGDFSCGIELLLTDTVLYRTVQESCRPYAAELFGASRIATRHAALYQEITGR